MESPYLKEILLQSIVRPQMLGENFDDTVTLPRQELVQFLTKTHAHSESKIVLTKGVYGLVIEWLCTFERNGRPTMLSAEDFAIIRFSDYVFSLVKDKLLPSSLFRSYVDGLNIVYCKLALLDLGYYTKSTHPGRQCMNGLYKATIGLNDEEMGYAQPILTKIDNIIKSVMVSYEESSDVFAILLADLKTFLSEYEKRVAVVEKRLRDTEVGKYNSQRAHVFVVENVNRYLDGASLPLAIEVFIKSDWVASLQLALLKEGSESSNWKKMLKLTETLIWCFGARTKVEMKSLYNFLMTLLNGLRNSLYAINHDEKRLALTVGIIEEELIRVMKGETLELNKCTPIEVGIVEVDEAMSEVPIDSLRFVSDLTVGDWLMLKREDGRVQFGKLAVIINGKGCYIFVNRFGMRLLEINKLDLSMLHKNKEIFLVEKGLVFDTAIAESVQHFKKIQLSKRMEAESVETESVDIPDNNINKSLDQSLNNSPDKRQRDKIFSQIKVDNTIDNNIEKTVASTDSPRVEPPLLTEAMTLIRTEHASKRKRIRLEETAYERVLKVRAAAQQRAKEKYEIDDAVMRDLPNTEDKSGSNEGGEEIQANELAIEETQSNEILTEDVQSKELESVESVVEEVAAKELEPTQTQDEHLDTGNIDTGNIDTGNTDKEDLHSEGFDLDALEPYLNEVDSINIGGWLEYEANGRAKNKCKLAVKMKVTKRLIFVDRVGAKALDLNRQKLAEMLAYGQAKIIDKGKVFDTTLEAVVKSIRKEKDGKRVL